MPRKVSVVLIDVSLHHSQLLESRNVLALGVVNVEACEEVSSLAEGQTTDVVGGTSRRCGRRARSSQRAEESEQSTVGVDTQLVGGTIVLTSRSAYITERSA